VGAIATAFGASLLAGVSIGVLCGTRGYAEGIRPRRFVREHRRLVEAVGVPVTGVTVLVAAAAVAGAGGLRVSLAPSCAAAAVLVAIAAWLLVVEADDGGESEASTEPKWWPQFERELFEWSRTRRTPTAPRG